MPLFNAFTKQGSGNFSRYENTAWKDYLSFSIALAFTFLDKFVYPDTIPNEMKSATEIAGNQRSSLD